MVELYPLNSGWGNRQWWGLHKFTLSV